MDILIYVYVYVMYMYNHARYTGTYFAIFHILHFFYDRLCMNVCVHVHVSV